MPKWFLDGSRRIQSDAANEESAEIERSLSYYTKLNMYGRGLVRLGLNGKDLVEMLSCAIMDNADDLPFLYGLLLECPSCWAVSSTDGRGSLRLQRHGTTGKKRKCNM